jgi:hypothetical protein
MSRVLLLTPQPAYSTQVQQLQPVVQQDQGPHLLLLLLLLLSPKCCR